MGRLVVPSKLGDKAVGTEVVADGEITEAATDAGAVAKLETDDGTAAATPDAAAVKTGMLPVDGAETVTADVGEIVEPTVEVVEVTEETVLVIGAIVPEATVLVTGETVPKV